MPSSRQQFKKKALAKPGVRAAYDELAEEFAFLDEVLKARTKAGVDAIGGCETCPPHSAPFRLKSSKATY